MICPNCQSENPTSNRFCGQCGEKLSAPPPDRAQAPAPNAAQDANGSQRPFIVSTTAMADVTAQMLNTRVSIPAPNLGSTSHSGYSSPLKPNSDAAPVDPKDEPIFTQHPNVHEFDLDAADLHASKERMESAAAEHEAHIPVTETPRSSGSILGLTAPVVRDSSARRIEEIREEVREEKSEPAATYNPNSFLHFDDSPAESTRSRDVSGPSFLGLGSASDDYLYDEQQPRSYGRIVVLLLVLGLVGVLGALEWRASQNGDSTNPMDVLHLKLPKKKGQGQVEVVQQSQNNPPANPTDANGGTNSVTNNGKPDLVAEPNSNAAKKPAESDIPAQNAQPTSQSPNATPAPSDNANASSSQAPLAPAWATGGASSANSKSVQPAAPSPKSAEPEAQPKEVAKAAPPSNAKPTAASTREARNSKTTAPADDVESDASLNGGAAELQKGIAAGDTELGRMWLWKALGKGNGEAPVRLADMYANGKGVPKDCEQAMLLLNAAAKKANVRARSKLGSMYATGSSCVPQDRVKAYKWMSAALEANPGSEWLTKNRDTLFQQMTPAERQRASR